MKGFIFDLDGVIVSTDEYHFAAWNMLAEREHIPYGREVNALQRGVSRMESLEILLRNAAKPYSDGEKQEMAAYKNSCYIRLIRNLRPGDILEGVERFLAESREKGIRCAVGSSSKNTAAILRSIGLDGFFDAVADGTMIRNSKPHPEVFLLAARLMDLAVQECAVFEDAASGIAAAKVAGMKAVAVGAAKDDPHADMGAQSLACITVEQVLGLF
ncbi:MAG: beta-phosphoglucomutase [Clostridia bacterium]|nr:beta-phosphoglucomutase [Clostridia bacterium]